MLLALCDEMINSTRNIELVKPLFEEYMWHMKQYVEIDDVQHWLQRAYGYLELYKTEPDRQIFIYTKEKEVCGFSMVNSPQRFNRTGKAISEFYVKPKYQLNGIGRMLAEHSFTEFKGLWEVCVISGNESAYIFWKDVISRLTSGNYQELSKESYDGIAFCFNST